jgi:hypothetical protein
MLFLFIENNLQSTFGLVSLSDKSFAWRCFDDGAPPAWFLHSVGVAHWKSCPSSIILSGSLPRSTCGEQLRLLRAPPTLIPPPAFSRGHHPTTERASQKKSLSVVARHLTICIGVSDPKTSADPVNRRGGPPPTWQHRESPAFQDFDHSTWLSHDQPPLQEHKVFHPHQRYNKFSLALATMNQSRPWTRPLWEWEYRSVAEPMASKIHQYSRVTIIRQFLKSPCTHDLKTWGNRLYPPLLWCDIRRSCEDRESHGQSASPIPRIDWSSHREDHKTNEEHYGNL